MYKFYMPENYPHLKYHGLYKLKKMIVIRSLQMKDSKKIFASTSPTKLCNFKQTNF